VGIYLADTSAWHHSRKRAGFWRSLLENQELAICVPVALELAYSTRSPKDFAALQDHVTGLNLLPLDERAGTAASATQAALVARAQHRGPTPMDLLIAAVAEVHGATLLHYDRHFDAIARVTGQPTEWLARRGSLD
jgi:predicted nucleic acid-binding protein